MADLDEFLQDLHEDGVRYDAAQPDRLQRRRNLDPASAEFLAAMVKATRAYAVLEIGTSNGYSTVWLADAVSETGGRVVSVDNDPEAAVAALENLEAVGLAGPVDLITSDAGTYLRELTDQVDLIFLDAERPAYAGYWPDLLRILRSGGLLVVDNVLSHPDEVADFLALTEEEPTILGGTLTIGAGLYLGARVDGG